MEGINNNYYENIVKEIKELIAKEDHDKAFDLLKEELSQPYVPKEILRELENIFENVFVEEVVSKQVTLEEAKKALSTLSIENVVTNFFTLNLRMLTEEILYYLKNSDDYLSMSLLIYHLINQGINMNFTLTKFNLTNTFNTLDINMLDEELMVKYMDLFEKEFEKTPVYVKYCSDILNYYFLVTFPFKLDNDFELYSEVVNYVKNVSGIDTLKNNEEFINIIEYGGI